MALSDLEKQAIVNFFSEANGRMMEEIGPDLLSEEISLICDSANWNVLLHLQLAEEGALLDKPNFMDWKTRRANFLMEFWMQNSKRKTASSQE